MKVDRLLERALFASRWLLAPIYLGLSGLLLLFAIRFARELVHLALEVPSISEVDVVLGALSLIDLALVAGLIVMIMLSGYENFVSGLTLKRPKKPYPGWVSSMLEP
jgi:uncharacterized protein (TIGR00645 family)